MSGSRVTPTLLCLAAVAFVVAEGAGPVLAKAVISIDKSTQQMSVLVDGVARYRFAVSTGRGGYSTPNGMYRPQRLARSWFSKKYYNSPMPHSIFFHGGYAIHGSYEISSLGGPASHGCIRLHPSNARALYALVQREGLGATTIVVHGSTPHSRSIRPRLYPDFDRRPPWSIFGYPN
jgi:lipoprotein-anchoring transpeptidase ErfK/SrfK